MAFHSNSPPKSHGGFRTGAGRKKGSMIKEPTTVVRVPESQKPVIKRFIEAYQRKEMQKSLDTVGAFEFPAIDAPKRALALYHSKVPAGLPSAADEYVEKRLDTNDYLIDNHDATFFVTIQGYSMVDSGLLPGDKVVVDRSKIPAIGDIVLAYIDGEYTIKQLGRNKDGRPRLLPSNSSGEFKPIDIKDSMSFEIWGVVTGSFRRFK
jgi:DNA polymerase V